VQGRGHAAGVRFEEGATGCYNLPWTWDRRQAAHYPKIQYPTHRNQFAMVQLSPSLILAALVVSGFANPIFKRTVSVVVSDINTIDSKVTALDQSIKAFDGKNIVAAATIHMNAQNVAKAVVQATSDIDSTARFDDDDGKTVVTAVQGVKPLIIAALEDITAKKAAFAALPVGGIIDLVENDLTTLNTNTIAFSKALSKAVPKDQVANVNSFQADVGAAFKAAIAAFA